LTLCDFASRNLNGDGILVDRMLRDGTREYLPVTFNLGVARVIHLVEPRAVPLHIAEIYDGLPDGPERFLNDFGVLEIIDLDLSPQSPALAERAAKNCATPNSVVAHFRNEFEAQWKRTTQSGEENGSLIFYEQATNNYMRISLSEGRHFEGGPAMPEIRREIRNARDYFSREGRTLHLLAIFHTHPNYPSGDSRSGDPSSGDEQLQSDYGNALGIIRTGKGYSFYSNGKTFWPDDPRANECIWTLNNQRR
jgi:hypothetical protein